MIRINLLEETRVAAKSKGGGFAMPQFQVAENVSLFVALGCILAALGVVGIIWMKNKVEMDRLDDKIQAAEKEKKRLEFILKKNEELEAKKAELQRRISIIEELKSKQDDPVRMLDQISQNLADGVWLEQLNFTTDKLDLTGWAQTPLAYATFLRNLEDSPYFLDVSTGVTETKKGYTKFKATAKFNPSGVRPPAPGTTPPAALSSAAPAPAAGEAARP